MPYHVALRQRLTAAVTVLGTLAVTLAALAGMPYVLWRATGIPWPEQVPSWAELGKRLAEPVSDPLVVDLLALVGWVCWAAFAFTVLREICWYTAHLPQLLHDRRAHHDHVASVSVKGSLAALCIGTLVAAALTLWRPHAASAQQPSSASDPRLHVTATAPLIPSPGEQAATLRTADATTSPHIASAISGEGHRGSSAGDEAVRLVQYTVREGDTLWDIAHTHLGDALKWPRIYALNKDRVQSDGARLRDPDLIKPGWQLTIPVSHHSTASLPTPTPAGPAPDSAAETPPAPTASAQPPLDQKPGSGRQLDGNQTPDAASRHHGDARDQKAAAGPGPAAIGFGEASLIGITAAAGLLAARRYWYLHQRRLRRPGDEAPAPALSPLVDKAAQAAHAAAQPRRPYDPEALITRRTPPQQPRSADTVTIGVEGDAEVPLDVLATAGGCTWTGPGAEGAARALLTGILTAAERQRPRPPHVKAIVTEEIAGCLLPGLPQRFTALTQATDTAQAVRMAEQHLIAHARAHNELDTPASGQAMARCPDEEDPGTLVVLTRPNAAHIGQVQAVATRSRPGVLIVLTLDTPLPDATHWHIDADGTTTRPHKRPHSASRLELFHLTPDAGRDMTQVLLGAHGQRPNLRVLPVLPAQSPSPHDNQPEPEAEADAVDDSEEEPGPSDDPHLTSASRPVQTKPVRLHVLGPVTLYARDHEEPVGTNLRPEVHEFLALLAAHPTGLLTSDIADKLHLATGSEHNALKNLRRAVRRALRTATGITTQEFILRQGELHKLNTGLVETDIADFTQRLKEASATGSKHPEKDVTHTVRQALTHYRGPFAQGGDYLWADAIREHLTTQATDAALRLAHQAEHTPTDPQQRDTVLGLLEHLGALHPDHERLTQHAIRLYQASGRHDAARHTYSRLERHLAELGLEPEPATRALLTPRAPSRHTR